MKVSNMTSNKGNTIANQFIINGATIIVNGRHETGIMFQSYDSNIVLETYDRKTYLDENTWDYSVTTGKYRNQFLGENKKETQAKIDSGEYKLVDLN